MFKSLIYSNVTLIIQLKFDWPLEIVCSQES